LILKRNSENFIGQVLAVMIKNTPIAKFCFLILRMGHQVMILLRETKFATPGVAGRPVLPACPARVCGISTQAFFFKNLKMSRLVPAAVFLWHGHAPDAGGEAVVRHPIIRPGFRVFPVRCGRLCLFPCD
jgi:hypothetical protein